MKKIIHTVLIALFSIGNVIAKDVPAPMGGDGFDNGGVVGGPIDDYVPLFMIIALLLGAWRIYKQFKIEKV